MIEGSFLYFKRNIEEDESLYWGIPLDHSASEIIIHLNHHLQNTVRL